MTTLLSSLPSPPPPSLHRPRHQQTWSHLVSTLKSPFHFSQESVDICIHFELKSTILTDANSLNLHATICAPTRVCSAVQSPRPPAAPRPDCLHARGRRLHQDCRLAHYEDRDQTLPVDRSLSTVKRWPDHLLNCQCFCPSSTLSTPSS